MNERIRRTWIDNKILLTIIGIFISSLLAWGIWVTDCVYCAKADEREAKQKTEQIRKDVDEVKQDVKEIKKENAQNQKEMLRILLDIKKDVTDGNKKK